MRGSRRLLLAGFVFAALAVTAAAQEGPVVESIEIKGNRWYSQEALLLRLKLRPGQRYDDQLIQDDILTLYRFFNEVRVERIPSDGKLKLEYHVKENPRTVAVRVIGNTEFDTDEILDRIQTQRGYPLFKYALSADRIRLEQDYRDLGYHFIQVVMDVRDVAGEKGSLAKLVTVRITEGPQVDVDDVVLLGNKSFDEDEILDGAGVVSRAWQWATFSSADFVQEALDRDLVAVMEFYRSEGYRDVRVWLGALEFSEDKEEVSIRIDIDEKEPYFIDEIKIEGGDSFPPDRSTLEGLLTVKVGDRYREEDLRESLRAIQTFYEESSYAGVRVDVGDLTYREEGTGVAVTFRVDEGGPVTIDRIIIEGNSRTLDKVIRRELSVIPGGPMNSVELRKSHRRLVGLGYFEPIPSIDVLNTTDPARKDVLIRVKEGNTGSIQFAAGIDSNLGLSGSVTLTKRNFDITDLPSSLLDVLESKALTGGGQTLRFFAAPGTTYSQFRVNFREPWLFDYRLGGDVEFYRTRAGRVGYRIDRIGLQVGVDKRWIFPGKELDDVLQTSIGFRIENPEIGAVDEDDAPRNAVADEGLHQVRSLRLGVAYSRLDSLSEPSRGWTTSLGYEWGTGLGTMEFHKFTLRGGVFETLYTDRIDRKHVVSLTGKVAWQTGYGGTDDIPISERFFLGGIGSIRGLRYRTVGPKSHDEPEGGEAMYHANLEYNFPIFERYIGGVLFVDVGNVTRKWGGPDFYRHIRVSPGFGIRIRIPYLGPRPVEIAFGFPIRRYDGDDVQTISFSFGRDF